MYSIIMIFLLTCVLPQTGSKAAQETLLSQGFLPGSNRSRNCGLQALPAPLLALAKVLVNV